MLVVVKGIEAEVVLVALVATATLASVGIEVEAERRQAGPQVVNVGVRQYKWLLGDTLP